MARYNNENDDDKIDPANIASDVQSNIKQEIIKELLHGSFQDNKTKLGNDALTLVVEIAKCLVTETCLRASNQALKEDSDKVDFEHVEQCLPQLFLRHNIQRSIQVLMHTADKVLSYHKKRVTSIPDY